MRRLDPSGGWSQDGAFSVEGDIDIAIWASVDGRNWDLQPGLDIGVGVRVDLAIASDGTLTVIADS